MEVVFSYSPESLAAFQRWYARRKRFGLQLLGLAMLMGGPPTVVFIVLEDHRAILAGWLVVLGFVVMGIANLRRSSREALTEIFEREIPTTHVVVTPSHLESRSKWEHARRGWGSIHDVHYSERYIFILIDDRRAFVIPREAFATTDKMLIFADTASRHLRNARDGTAPALESTTDAESTLGPARATVNFVESPADMAAVIHKMSKQIGAGKSQRGRVASAMGRTRFFIAVILLTFAGIIFSPAGVLGYVAWTIAMGVIGAFVVQWLSRRRGASLANNKTITISETGFLDQTPEREVFTFWPAISDVTATSRFVVFFASAWSPVLVIPKSAFASREEASRFAALARQYCQAEKSRHASDDENRATSLPDEIP